ncbi:radical SAM/SPASM domain-containing protein [Enterococcus cecorum]|uniref:radical SAM/SPASM domain-containing protein n=1 Tax=Enterococcus cecorum TaxID=44008 RepID=UPI0007618C41|nr:radical SAM protein [Enterococcus cecorum]
MLDNSEKKAYVIKKSHLLSIEYLLRHTDTVGYDIPKSLKSVLSFFKSRNIVINRKTVKLIQFYSKIPLRTVQLEITNRCNLRCKHCYIPSYTDDLEVEDILKIIDESERLGVMNFCITGGEPLLHTDIEKILIYLLQTGMNITIFSNLINLNDNIKRIIVLSDRISFKVSLDGGTPEVHDYIRGKGSFKKTYNNILWLKKMRVPVEVNVVLNSANISEIDALESLSRKLDIRFRYDKFIPFERGDELQLPDEEYIDNMLRIESVDFSKLKQHKKINTSCFYCEAGNSYVYINNEGYVTFCPTLSSNKFSGGNVRSQSLKEIWESSTFFKRIRNIRCKYFEECKLNYICNGGCRSRAESYRGNIDDPDILECKMAFCLTGITPPSFREILE